MFEKPCEVINGAIKIWVTRKACHECMMTPERAMTAEQVERVINYSLYEDDMHHIPECHCVQIRRMRHWGVGVPQGTVCCFGYFYRFAYENVWLRDALEHGVIEYFDIEGWEGLRESGLMFCEPLIVDGQVLAPPDVLERVQQKLVLQRSEGGRQRLR